MTKSLRRSHLPPRVPFATSSKAPQEIVRTDIPLGTVFGKESLPKNLKFLDGAMCVGMEDNNYLCVGPDLFAGEAISLTLSNEKMRHLYPAGGKPYLGGLESWNTLLSSGFAKKAGVEPGEYYFTQVSRGAPVCVREVTQDFTLAVENEGLNGPSEAHARVFYKVSPSKLSLKALNL